MNKIDYVKIQDYVYNFKTKYDRGFTDDEINTVLKDFPDINVKKFDEALWCNTCQVIDDKIITYHQDIQKAIICGLQNRDLTTEEWD
jgi:hypothetical protein